MEGREYCLNKNSGIYTKINFFFIITKLGRFQTYFTKKFGPYYLHQTVIAQFTLKWYFSWDFLIGENHIHFPYWYLLIIGLAKGEPSKKKTKMSIQFLEAIIKRFNNVLQYEILYFQWGRNWWESEDSSSPKFGNFIENNSNIWKKLVQILT